MNKDPERESHTPGDAGRTLEQLGRRLNVRERREHLWIRKLRRLPCWEQVIKKLIAGESVTSVAKWLVDMELEGEFKSVGYEGWRKYLGAVKARIDMAGFERKDVEPLKYRAVVEEFARQKNSGLLEGNAVPSLRSLSE